MEFFSIQIYQIEVDREIFPTTPHLDQLVVVLL